MHKQYKTSMRFIITQILFVNGHQKNLLLTFMTQLWVIYDANVEAVCFVIKKK